MKTFFAFLFLLITFTSFAQNTSTNNGPLINFDIQSFDFGDIKQGTKVEHSFKYTNSGTEPLIISDVVTTCGCTATKWTKEPLLPGQSKELLATFDSNGKEGRQHKVITILSNAKNVPSRISIVANVVPAK